jgi:hypothetical protein
VICVLVTLETTREGKSNEGPFVVCHAIEVNTSEEQCPPKPGRMEREIMKGRIALNAEK